MKLLTMILASLALTSAATGQVRYRLAGGADTNLPTDRIINVGTLTVPTLLHIFDATGADESIVGQVVVKGSVSTGGSLLVQIAASSAGNVFNTAETVQPFLEGLRDFGGIRFEHPSNSSDTTLRDNAVVAATMLGDLTGEVAQKQQQPWHRSRLCDFCVSRA